MERSLAIRFTVRDADKARADLQKVSDGFEATSKDLSRAASDARREVNKLAREARLSGEGLDAQTEAARAADTALTSVTRAEQRAARQAETLNTAVAELARRHRAGEISADQMRNSVRALERLYGETAQSARVLGRTTGRLEQGVARARRAFSGLSGTLGALGLTATAEGLRRVAGSALSAAESIADVSVRTGIAAERLQGLRAAFDQNGGSAERMDQALSRFNRRIGLAAEGSGAAASAVERLGIRVTDASGNLRDTGAVFNDVVAAISGLESSAGRAAIASQFFGEEAGPALAPLLAQGVGALDAYTERLRRAGTLMSDDLVRAGAQASASVRRVSDDIGTAFQIGLLEGFVDETDELNDSLRSLVPLARDAGKFVGELIDAVVENRQEIAAAAAAFTAFQFAASITTKLPAPATLKLLIPLLSAAGAGLASYSVSASDASESTEELNSRIGGLRDEAQELDGAANTLTRFAAAIGNGLRTGDLDSINDQFAELAREGGDLAEVFSELQLRFGEIDDQEEARQALEFLTEKIGEQRGEAAELRDRAEELAAQLANVGDGGDDAAGGIDNAGDAAGDASEKIKAMAEAAARASGARGEGLRDLRERVAELTRELDPAGAAIADYRANADLLRTALATGVIDAEQFERAMAALNREFAEGSSAAEDVGETTREFGATFDAVMANLEDRGSDAAQVFEQVWAQAVRAISDQLADLAFGLEGSFSPRRLGSSLLSSTIIQPALGGLPGGAANDNGSDPFDIASNVSSLVPSVGGNLVSAGTLASAVPSLFSTGAVEAGTGALAANSLGSFAASLTNPVTLGLGAVTAIVALTDAFGALKDEIKADFSLITTQQRQSGPFQGESFGGGSESPFGVVGTIDKELDKAGGKERIEQTITDRVAELDRQIAQFLSDAQVEAVREALQAGGIGQKGAGARGIEVEVGKKLNEGEIVQAMADRIAEIFQAIGANVPEAIRRAATSEKGTQADLEAAIQDLEIIRQIREGAFAAPEFGSATIATLDQMAAQFERLREEGERLGVSTEGLADRFEAATERVRSTRAATLELEAADLSRPGQALIGLAQRRVGLEQEEEAGIIDQDTLEAIFQRSFDRAISGLSLKELRKLEDVIADVGDEIPNSSDLLDALSAAIKDFGDSAGDAADQIKTAADALATTDLAQTRAQGAQAAIEALGREASTGTLLRAAGIAPSVQALIGTDPEAAADLQAFVTSLNDVREAADDDALRTGFNALDDLLASGALSAQQFNAAIGLLTGAFAESEAQAEEAAQAEEQRQQEQQQAVAEAERAVIDARRRLVGLLEEERSELQQTADEFGRFAEQLQQTQRDLRFGATSPLSPERRFTELRAEFERVQRQARLGDEEALARLPEVARLLDQARVDFLGSSTARSVAVFQDIQQALDLAGDTAERQESLAEQQIGRLDAQIDAQRDAIAAIEGTSAAVDSVAEATREVRDAVLELRDISDDDSAGGPLPDLPAAPVPPAPTPPPPPEPPGVLPVAGPSDDPDVNRMLAAARAAGIPGFDTGGSFVVPGSGRDDLVPLIRVSGGEQVTVTPTRGAPGGDNREVVRELRRVSDKLDRLLAVEVERGEIEAEDAAGMRQEFRELRRAVGG